VETWLQTGGNIVVTLRPVIDAAQKKVRGLTNFFTFFAADTLAL
jgi:hypothetical protein